MDVEDLDYSFDKFFESNVVIPKGENRRDDALVWHQFAEDASLIVGFKDKNNKFHTAGIEYHDEYCIKPSEPIFEWQWVLTDRNKMQIARTVFMTEEEFNKSEHIGAEWDCDFDTKRERK